MKSPHDILNQYLKEKGIRQSEQRLKVLDIFLKTERHLTIVEIYELARKSYPKIGYATVYRAMKVLCKTGLADEINFGDRVRRFEHKYGHEHHDHLVCIRCGRFIEAVSPKIERLQKNMAKHHRFTLIRHKMYLFGVCKDCGKKQEKKR